MKMKDSEIPKFQSSDFDYSMLVIPSPITCENFKSFGALLEIASFSFLDRDFRNNPN